MYMTDYIVLSLYIPRNSRFKSKHSHHYIVGQREILVHARTDSGAGVGIDDDSIQKVSFLPFSSFGLASRLTLSIEACHYRV
jgi:hypothetical protein